MFRITTKLLIFSVAPALVAHGSASAFSATSTPIMNLPIDYGDPYQTGDGPCYDAARKFLSECLKAARAAGSVAAGEECRLAYAAQVAECDRQMGN